MADKTKPEDRQEYIKAKIRKYGKNWKEHISSGDPGEWKSKPNIKREQKKMKEPLSPSKRRALRIQKEDIASGETAAAKAFMTRNLPYTGDIHGKKLNKGGRAGFQHGGRTNLLEELGRVEGEHSNRNRRAEVSRIHGELNRGYKHGGPVGAAKRGFNKKILRKD